MQALISEWLHLVVRWMHVLAGIMWIGTSIFFNWLDSHLEPSLEKKPGVEGELWMVHSGGFYQVEKKHVAPEKLPATLHWFKWEAGFTWLTGAFLLGLVYYGGGGVLLTDPHVNEIGTWPAIGICVGTLAASWFVYDWLWISPLRNKPAIAVVIMIAMIVGCAHGFSHLLSGRAAFIHTGAMMGTWMAWNVWVRIIPAQKALVEATRKGTKPDPELGKKAKQRSRHNNYMTYPVVFIMLSNHFPSTYGSHWNWIILVVLMVVGALARHFENTGDRSPGWVFAVLTVVALVANSKLTEVPEGEAGSADAGPIVDAAPSVGGARATDPGVDEKTAGTIEGVVKFTGPEPKHKTLAIPSTCAPDRKGPSYNTDILVKDGKLQNAFVWIKSGIADWKGPPPDDELVVDQKGCMYNPRIMGAQTGQRVTFTNSDPVLHNVRVVAKNNPEFNLNLATKGMRIGKTFDAPEVMLGAKCDVHPWMSGFIGIAPHPFFAVSGPKGEFSLKNVPPGDYVVEAWHEVYGKRETKVTVAANGDAKIELSFAP